MHRKRRQKTGNKIAETRHYIDLARVKARGLGRRNREIRARTEHTVRAVDIQRSGVTESRDVH